VMSKDKMSAEKQKIYLIELEKALMIGDSVLRTGGTSQDAVINVISYMEACPLFNAGRGAVFTWKGNVELDASIMDGKTLKAGAIAGATRIKSPIHAARAVMDASPHVLLSGKGTTQFARKNGLEMVPNHYFFTKERRTALKEYKKQNEEQKDKKHFGTVGCVALDKNGNLCAGTSTGGMTGKRYGRIGDAPIIGAGTYANNETCAVSCTGHGEFFIRLAIAHDVSSQIGNLHISLQEAASNSITKLTRLGGTGGLIAIDTKANITMPFNTSGMFRGYIKSSGEKEIAIFTTE